MWKPLTDEQVALIEQACGISAPTSTTSPMPIGKATWHGNLEGSKSTANATNPKDNLVDWCETLDIVLIRPVYKVHPAGWVYRSFERASIHRVSNFFQYIYIWSNWMFSLSMKRRILCLLLGFQSVASGHPIVARALCFHPQERL